MGDPVPVITREHFEEGYKYARMSVNEVDIQKYMEFKKKFEPSNQGSGRTENVNFGWPDDKGDAGKAGKTGGKKREDRNAGLDLYS